MATIRKPFQGISNIIRFNWHFYVMAFIVILALFFFSNYVNETLMLVMQILAGLAFISVVLSLVVSYYVYDLSRLYKLDWITSSGDNFKILNINAGFDETTDLLRLKFKNSEVFSYDFYDSEKHTEVSIKRARKAFPPSSDVVKFKTSKLDLADNSIDKIYLILSAHEVRNNDEKNTFFVDLKRVLKLDGEILVVEHLRDIPNLMAYNIGAFHFFSKNTWLNVFKQSGLNLVKEIKQTPFISIFKLD